MIIHDIEVNHRETKQLFLGDKAWNSLLYFLFICAKLLLRCLNKRVLPVPVYCHDFLLSANQYR